MGTRSSGSGSGWRGASSPNSAYLLEGSVLEAWEGPKLRETGPAGHRRSVAAWRIRRGRINGVDVSGQVVLVLTYPRGAPDDIVAQVILLDERANPEQVLALLDAFRGRLGGSLADLAPSLAEEGVFSQVPIEYGLDGRRGVVSVPHRFKLVIWLDPAGASDPAPVCNAGQLPTVTGRPGRASDIWVNVPEHDLAWYGNDYAAAYREFRFYSRPENLRSKSELSRKEGAMPTMTPDQMDRVIDEHFAAEANHDLEGLLATLTDDAEHDVVGMMADPHHGSDEIRAFYEKVFKALQQEGVQPLRRFYGDNFLVDEVIYSGQADGALFGLEGRSGKVSFRVLHLVEFRDGRMARENVWLDSETARQQLLSGEG
jgi:ketosteroid isomerase-like protein